MRGNWRILRRTRGAKRINGTEKKLGKGLKFQKSVPMRELSAVPGRFPSREEPWLGKKNHGSRQGVREVVCAPGAHCAGVAHLRFWLRL